MPDIIDSMMVSLGLDRSGFEKGKTDTDRDLDDMANRSRKRTGEVEDGAKAMGQAFAKLRGELTGLLLTFAGAKSITQFAENLVDATAKVGRSASTLGVGVNNLNAMGDTIKANGGSAQEATAMAGRISDIRANMIRHPDAVNGQLMNQLGITNRGAFDSMEGLQYILADRFQKEMAGAKGDPTKENDVRATFRQRVQELLGASDEWVNMLEKGTPAIREQIALFEKQDPVTKANTEAAQHLQESLEHLEASMAGLARKTGAIEALDGLASVIDVLSGSADNLNDSGKALAAGFTLLAHPLDMLVLVLAKAGLVSKEDAKNYVSQDTDVAAMGHFLQTPPDGAGGLGGAVGGGLGGAVGGANYDAVVGHVDAAHVSGMAMGDLIQYGRQVLIPRTKARGIGRDKYGRLLGSSAAGAYQITGSTIEQFAPQVFGTDWRSQKFDAAAQDKLGEAIFNSGKYGDLANVWTSLHDHRPGAYARVPWGQMRGALAAGEGGHLKVTVEHPHGTTATVDHTTGHGTKRILHNRHRVANSNTGMG